MDWWDVGVICDLGCSAPQGTRQWEEDTGLPPHSPAALSRPGTGPESEAAAALGSGQGRRGPPLGCGGASPSSRGPSAGAGSTFLSGELPPCMLSSAEPTFPAEMPGGGVVLAFPTLLPGPPATSLPTCPHRLPLPTLC